MEKPQIKQIGKYLKNLEENLYEDNYDSIAVRAELPNLYQTIKLLMDETFKTEDQELKTLLAYMEMRLRKCKQVMEDRLGMRN